MEKISNQEAERAVIASVLFDSECAPKVFDILNPEDFYSTKNKIIFTSLLDMHNKNKNIDLVTVSGDLMDKNRLFQAGGASYLSEISMVPFSSSIVDKYAYMVRDKSVIRSLVESMESIISRAKTGQESIEELTASAQKSILSITETKNNGTYESVSEILKKTVRKIEECQKNGGMMPGLSTGFSNIDRVLNGLRGGMVYIIAARPGNGKSAMLLNIADHVSSQGKYVYLHTLEMPNKELSFRLLAAETGIESRRLVGGRISDAEMAKVIQAASKKSKNTLYCDDEGGIRIDKLISRARRRKMETGIDLLLIDYLQLANPSQKWKVREQQVSEVSRSLKALAKELDIPVIAAAQINREIDNRKDKEPTLADLRESGAIEQDADVVAFIHLITDDKTVFDAAAKLTIAKNRQGSTGSIPMIFHKKETRFQEQ